MKIEELLAGIGLSVCFAVFVSVWINFLATPDPSVVKAEEATHAADVAAAEARHVQGREKFRPGAAEEAQRLNALAKNLGLHASPNLLTPNQVIQEGLVPADMVHQEEEGAVVRSAWGTRINIEQRLHEGDVVNDIVYTGLAEEACEELVLRQAGAFREVEVGQYVWKSRAFDFDPQEFENMLPSYHPDYAWYVERRTGCKSGEVRFTR